ncbi:YecR family lipoprotein [Candidatus Binatus sp.]|uniref:YecR family lipoprotein n=1 Tax=Candidatus Binatus sp. TaxID=2811406 RepID=UPI00351CC798
MQRPTVDEEQGVKLASSTCSEWGYSGSKPFGSGLQTCTAISGYGCMAYRVTRKYQCLGSPTGARAS